MVDSVKTEKKQKSDGRLQNPQIFKPGQSGNPKGRPKGSTEWSEIKKVFRRVFFDVGGEEKLKQMCKTNSGFREFSKYLIAIMPREVEGGRGPAIINYISTNQMPYDRNAILPVEGRGKVVKQA